MRLQQNYINSFLVTAQCSSFSAAAEKLYISHPALLRQINALEKELGFTLFIRSPRGIRLTPAGEHFYTRILKIERQTEQLISECIRMEKDMSVIRIGNLNDLATFGFSSEVYRAFQRENSHITLEFIPTTKESLLEDCLSSRIDIALYFGPRRLRIKGLVYQPVVQHIKLLMAKDHPLADRNAITAQDLAGHDVYSSTFSYDEYNVEQIPATAKARMHTVDMSMDRIYQMCSEGNIFLLPAQYAPFFPSLTCREMDPPGRYEMNMVLREDAAPCVKKLIDFYIAYEK